MQDGLLIDLKHKDSFIKLISILKSLKQVRMYNWQFDLNDDKSQ